eukprot:UN32493
MRLLHHVLKFLQFYVSVSASIRIGKNWTVNSRAKSLRQLRFTCVTNNAIQEHRFK